MKRRGRKRRLCSRPVAGRLVSGGTLSGGTSEVDGTIFGQKAVELGYMR